VKTFGTLIAAFGRQYEVRSDAGEILLCVPRGKKSLFACGDRVQIAPTAPARASSTSWWSVAACSTAPTRGGRS
jgi:hypothetical protein